MSQLAQEMKVLWATNFAGYLKSHGYHMNVTGSDFYQYHKLLQKVYEQLQDSIDDLGEGLRTLREVVPANLNRIAELSRLKEETVVPGPDTMVQVLYDDLHTIIDQANLVFDLCQTEKQYGLQNIIADYLQQVHKLDWMLDSTESPPQETEGGYTNRKE